MKTKQLIFIITGFALLSNLKAVTPGELFPEFSDWDLNIDETVYVPENLWELIDGAAEVYLAYDFKDLHIGEYTNKKDNMIRVELYRHADGNNTFGIYSSERMPDYRFITIGTEGYTSFGALNFFTGNYYIKMIWSGTSDTSDSLLIELAKEIEEKLNQENRWPEILSFFPEENRILKSEAYSNENFLGYSFLHSAFTAGYQTDGGNFRLFILKLNDEDEAGLILDKYFKTIKYSFSGETKEQYIVEDPYNGILGIGTKKNYLFGVYNMDDTQLIKKYLDQLREKI